GRGAHLVTPNDYLSRVGAGWMGPIYLRLGVSCAVIAHEFAGMYNPNFNDPNPHSDDRLNHFMPIARREAYAADILYGTNNEFGFDYLRDNMKFRLTDYVQRDLNFAIVDEVDSILIDEARTPLIISGSTEASSKLYVSADAGMRKLKKEEDYEVDEKARSVQLTEKGNDKMEEFFNIANLYAIENINLLHHI